MNLFFYISEKLNIRLRDGANPHQLISQMQITRGDIGQEFSNLPGLVDLHIGVKLICCIKFSIKHFETPTSTLIGLLNYVNQYKPAS